MRTGHRSHGLPGELHVEIVDASPFDASGDVRESFLILHGLGGTHRDWTVADAASFLPPGSALVDLFGLGDSPGPLTRYTLDTAPIDQARDLVGKQDD